MPYITVAQSAETEIVIEKSRFITHVFPAADEETAKDCIQKIAKQYWDANHNCYAYIIGENRHLQKASDDGEPSGTAGVPILEVIKKNGLTDTLIIVTRYFGGIKLGAGGLVRAYTRSASEGIKRVKLLRKEEHTFFELTMDYATWSRIEQQLNPIGIIHDKVFTENVTVTFSVPAPRQNELIQNLDKWGSGRIQYNRTKKEYVAMPL